MTRHIVRGPAFPAAGRQSDLTNAAIVWTECLHGNLPIREALSAVSQTTGAVAAILYRCCITTRRPRIITTFHGDAATGVQPILHPVGPDLIAVGLHRARPGTVWRLEDAGADLAGRIETLSQRNAAGRRIADVVAIPLGQTDGIVDVLELYLEGPATPGLVVSLGELARSLSFAWSRRPQGRIARLLASSPAIDKRLRGSHGDAPVSIGNPWRLTPTEMRICNLIREGQDPARLVTLIGVTESTIRTHLRSIYAKAGVSGQVGLLRLLLSDAPARHA